MAVWELLRMPGALKRAGMDAAVMGIEIGHVMTLAVAGGIEESVTAALLQLVEHRLVTATRSEGEDDGS